MATSQVTPPANEAELRPPESTFQIDIRGIISPFHTPTLTEVIAAVEAAVPQPQVPLVFEGWGHAKGTYTFETYDPISIRDIPKIKLPCNRSSDEVVEIDVQPLPKRVRQQRQPREEGLLITLTHAARADSRKLSHDIFDKAFVDSKIGRIIKNTEFQIDNKTKKMNGNRYLVMVIDEGKLVPDNITVIDPATKKAHTYRTKYIGKVWLCRRCGENHTGKCPVAEKLRVLGEQKAEKVIDQRIYGDSVTRFVESKALVAETISMPGGHFGQILNSIYDDPESQKQKDIFIFGGQNDIIDRHIPEENSHLHYVHNVSLLHKKWTILLNDQRFKDTTFHTIHTTNSALLTPIQRARYELLIYIIKDLTNRFPDKLKQSKYTPQTDDKGHPTAPATAELLNAVMPQNVLDPTVAYTNILYGGVTSLWRYGCLGCAKNGVYPSSKCDTCTNDISEFKNEPLLNYFKDLIAAAEKDVEVKQTGSKRQSSSPLKPNQKKQVAAGDSRSRANSLKIQDPFSSQDVEMRGRSNSEIEKKSSTTQEIQNVSQQANTGNARN